MLVLAPASYRQGKVLEETGLNLSSVAMESEHIAILCGNTIQRVSKQHMQHKKKIQTLLTYTEKQRVDYSTNTLHLFCMRDLKLTHLSPFTSQFSLTSEESVS